MSSTQGNLIGVLVLLIVILAINNCSTWIRNRRSQQQHQRHNSPSPPPVRLQDVLARDVFVREDSNEPPILSRHGSPAPNILLRPPAVPCDGNLQVVYDDQIAIINRVNGQQQQQQQHQQEEEEQQQHQQEEEQQQLQQEEQQQLQQDEEEEQQQHQGSVMSYTLNSLIQNAETFEYPLVELISFNAIDSDSTSGNIDHTCISMM